MGIIKNKVGRPSKKTIRVKIIIRILLFILLAVAAYFVGYFLNSMGTSNKDDIITKENLSTIATDEWKTPKGTAGEVNIYESLEYKTLSIETSENSNWLNNENEYKKKYTYKCSAEDCSGENIYEYLNYAVIKDENYIIYDYKKNKYKDIKLDNLDFEKLSLLYYDGKIYGYALYDINDNVAIYNLNEKKLVTDFEYKSYFYEDNPELIDDNLILSKENSICMIDFKTGKIKKEYEYSQDEYTDENFTIRAIGNGKYVYYIKEYGFDIFDSEICDDDFKNIFGQKRFSLYTVLKNGNIIVKEENDFKEYKNDGSLVRESKNYKSIVAMGYEYIAVVDTDDYLKIVDNKGNEKASFVKITDKHYIHEMLSGWYKTSGKEGLYVVVEDENVEIGTLGRGVEYYYEPTKDKVGRIELTEIGGYAKPVLYLYPTSNNTKITINFERPELLNTTYPKYINNWTVYANKNGDLTDLDGNKYYALYWDEKTYKKVSFDKGFYVTKENAITFLEEKLDYIGLNYKEKNEFIMYWLPILEKNEKSLVYFEFTGSRQQFNELKINPKPDSILRLAIHIKKVNEKTNIKKQELIKFNRNGFSVVEWGGVNY